MSYIIIPGRRTRQPSGFVALNPAIPRPSFLFCPSVGLLDWTLPSRVGTKASGDSLRGTAQGIAYKVARATNGGLDFGVASPITGDSWTIFVLANPASGDGVSALFSQRAGTSPFQQIDLVANGRGLTSSAGDLSFVIYNSAAIDTYTTAQTAVDGAWHGFTAIRSGSATGPQLRRDGEVLSTTITGSSVSTTGGTKKVRLGNLGDYTSDGIYAASCDIALAIAWNNVLSDALLARFNPREIWETVFAPDVRRIYFGAGGGTTTTDAAIAGTQATDVAAIAVEATTGAAIAGAQATDVAAITVEATTGAALAGTQATDVAAVTVEATTGAAIAGTQDSDVAALVVDSEVGTTTCAIGGTQAPDVAAIDVEATLGLALAATQASDLGYIVVEATLPAAVAATQSSDVAAASVSVGGIWTDVGVSAATWADVGAASSIWTDL